MSLKITTIGASRFAIVLAALIPTLGHAQTVATPAETTVDPNEQDRTGTAPDGSGIQQDAGDIIVTAQRRSESINRVPLSIHAFSGERLAAAGGVDASGLSQVTSGLNFARSSANTPIYTLRGIGFNTPNLSSTSPVGLYVDEVAYAYLQTALVIMSSASADVCMERSATEYLDNPRVWPFVTV